MTNGLVSLVMAAWQPRPDWLRDAVASALGQEGCELELIVVDDGSPEPVEGLLEGIDDPRLRVLRVEHGGESRARNAGIAAARGDFFRFVDSDDTLEPGSTARLLALCGRDGAIGYGGTAVCDEHLRPQWTMTSSLSGWIREECLLGHWTVRLFSVVFPRAVVEATGEWDPGFRVSHDWDYALRALEHAPVRGEHDVATYYRKHASAATGDFDAGEAGARRVLARYFERHPEQRGTRLERRAEAVVEAIAARALLTRRRPAAAAQRAARALGRDPRALVAEAARAAPALRSAVGRRLARRS